MNHGLIRWTAKGKIGLVYVRVVPLVSKGVEVEYNNHNNNTRITLGRRKRCSKGQGVGGSVEALHLIVNARY